jgi:hypothetical protein
MPAYMESRARPGLTNDNMDSLFGSAAAGLLGLAEDDQSGYGTTHC